MYCQPTLREAIRVDKNFQDPSDRISYVCAWLALVPQALCIVYATLIWSSREAEVILMFAGQLGCEACNFLLKRYIKEHRPTSTVPIGNVCYRSAMQSLISI